MTVKESFNVAGLHTTWGNPAFKEYVAGWDATVVRRLKQAGAIIVGKTNVLFMLGDFAQTANELYGVTSNPWDLTRTPGGSSGGGAAALSAGMTFLEYGSDLVGSIRIPASFCGVYGLKPSMGIHERAPVSSEITALLSDAVDALARAGATVVEGWPEGVDPGQASESFGFHVGLFFAFQEPGESFAELSEVIEHENRRMAARAAWGRYFHDIDVFLSPANFTPAFPHDDRPFDERTITTPEGEQPYTNQTFRISRASLPGLPAVVAPIGRTSAGLPVGAQIISPLYEDDTALTFAELLARVIGGYVPPPI
jgi:Asp-tRNA(Asn)/Glu-tRNA(Gln) amidotransferase A subunit family amidase